jgi:DNA-binding transcriptional regulator YiaG
MALKTKIQKSYEDHGFGFPVKLLNVPMIEVRGEYVPNVNQNELQRRVVEALAFKPSRLTGNELRFLRHFAGMTLVQFAARLDVTHPAVLKWEKRGTKATGMSWPTEKDIRLFALLKIDAKQRHFVEAYSELEQVFPESYKEIKIDLEKRSA